MVKSFALHRAISHSACSPRRVLGLWPPISPGAALPLARYLATHLIAELGATPNRAAARLRDTPSCSTAKTTRSRKSNEAGLPILSCLPSSREFESDLS